MRSLLAVLLVGAEATTLTLDPWQVGVSTLPRDSAAMAVGYYNETVWFGRILEPHTLLTFPSGPP